jgi:nicotinic acid mononucleotide adenylyltransferase
MIWICNLITLLDWKFVESVRLKHGRNGCLSVIPVGWPGLSHLGTLLLASAQLVSFSSSPIGESNEVALFSIASIETFFNSNLDVKVLSLEGAVMVDDTLCSKLQNLSSISFDQISTSHDSSLSSDRMLSLSPIVHSIISRYMLPFESSNDSLSKTSQEIANEPLARGVHGLSHPQERVSFSATSSLEHPEYAKHGSLNQTQEISKHVLIIGGSFSPPTLAHIELRRILNQFSKSILDNTNARVREADDATVNEIWYVPCGARWDKKVNVSAIDRYIMTTIALEHDIVNHASNSSNSPSIDIPAYCIPLELIFPSVNHNEMEAIPSYVLLSSLSNYFRASNAKFSLLIGSDLLPTLHSWYQAEKLLSTVSFYVIDRPLYNSERNDYVYPKNITHVISPSRAPISSTHARTSLQANYRGINDVLQYIDEYTLRYIYMRGLYRDR